MSCENYKGTASLVYLNLNVFAIHKAEARSFNINFFITHFKQKDAHAG